MVVCGRDEGLIIDFGLLIDWLSGEGVSGWLNFVYISVFLLLFCTHFFIVLFELLGWSEAWQKWKVRSHLNITYLKYILTWNMHKNNS
jgi:hypothetical protein